MKKPNDPNGIRIRDLPACSTVPQPTAPPPIRVALGMSQFYTVCPTRYRIRHYFNNSNTNEVTAMKFEQEYVRCVRNEEEWGMCL